jgi:DNA polymerase-3 subunit epsilon
MINVIFWDTETNGLEKTNSVLSISAIKYTFSVSDEKIENNKIDQYERFYFRKLGEAIGKEAIAVNGLTDEMISKKRNGDDYPEHFCDDIASFRSFCKDTRHFVGHNIFYDKQYLNFWLPNIFCTMKANTKIIGLKRANGKIKFPSLEETAKFYGIEVDKNEMHGSMYDSFVTYQVFCRMLENEGVRGKVLTFLNKY